MRHKSCGRGLLNSIGRFAVAGLVGVTFCISGYAASFEPAQIGTHDFSLANRIKMPRVKGDFTVFVRCEAEVGASGKIRRNGCYDDADVDDKFFKAVELAANRARFVPARVDGEPVKVLALYSVVFRRQGDVDRVGVIPNHGTNAQDFGINYVAPQRYGTPSKVRGIDYRDLSGAGDDPDGLRTRTGLQWVEAEIDGRGRCRSATVIRTAQSSKGGMRMAKRVVDSGPYIPGFVNSQPVAMRYIEPFYDERGGFLWYDKTKCRADAMTCRRGSN